MIFSQPTRYGGGLTIWGDYHDLKSLHSTLHELCASPPLEGKFGDVALGLAYDVRHAYQHRREARAFGQDKDSRVQYYGVSIVWPIYLVQVALLRWAANFQATKKLQQANLFLLESRVEESLSKYDAKVGACSFE